MLDNASDYKYIDVTDIDIQGRIVPTEDVDGLPLALRKEDFAWLIEALLERNVYDAYVIDGWAEESGIAEGVWHVTSRGTMSAEERWRTYFFQKLRIPGGILAVIVDAYCSEEHARLGWRIPTNAARFWTQEGFEEWKDASLLKGSDLAWPASLGWSMSSKDDLYYCPLPSAPSAAMMRGIFYNANRIGGRWDEIRRVQQSGEWTRHVDYNDSEIWTNTSSGETILEDVAEANTDTTGDTFQYTESYNGSTSTRTSGVFTGTYLSVFRDIAFSDVWTSETYNVPRRKTLTAILKGTPHIRIDAYKYNPVMGHGASGPNMDAPYFFLVYEILRQTPTGGSFGSFRGSGFQSVGYALYRAGALTRIDDDEHPAYISEDGNTIGREYEIPALSLLQYIQLVRGVDSGAFTGNYDYVVALRSVWVFDNRTFRTELPSAWTWTPQGANP